MRRHPGVSRETAEQMMDELGFLATAKSFLPLIVITWEEALLLLVFSHL